MRRSKAAEAKLIPPGLLTPTLKITQSKWRSTGETLELLRQNHPDYQVEKIRPKVVEVELKIGNNELDIAAFMAEGASRIGFRIQERAWDKGSASVYCKTDGNKLASFFVAEEPVEDGIYAKANVPFLPAQGVLYPCLLILVLRSIADPLILRLGMSVEEGFVEISLDPVPYFAKLEPAVLRAKQLSTGNITSGPYADPLTRRLLKSLRRK